MRGESFLAKQVKLKWLIRWDSGFLLWLSPCIQINVLHISNKIIDFQIKCTFFPLNLLGFYGCTFEIGFHGERRGKNLFLRTELPDFLPSLWKQYRLKQSFGFRQIRLKSLSNLCIKPRLKIGLFKSCTFEVEWERFNMIQTTIVLKSLWGIPARNSCRK